MKRTIRWSILMAILGFILGLGFLIPIPAYEVREPASDKSDPPPPYLKPELPPGDGPLTRTDDTPSRGSSFTESLEKIDRRQDVLIDIHTVARSRYTKNTDAYVVTLFRAGGRDEITAFSYCDNYDFEKNRARTDLSRYATSVDNPAQRFNCLTLRLDPLQRGVNIVNSIFGPVLTLKTKNFNPRTGGTLSVIFAYHLSKVGLGNDYRTLDFNLTLNKGTVSIKGPGDEYFDWFDLHMSEDMVGLPSGVNAFELFSKGIPVSKYKGGSFDKVNKKNTPR